MPEALPEDLSSELARTAARRGRIGHRVCYFPDIASTNDEAARLAELGAEEGTVVLASAQTAGRGRLGRTWFSPPGAGLYLSIVCRGSEAAPYLSLAGGVAVADGVLAATGLPVEIKWPNDIVVDAGLGRRRKLAGVLAEASTSAEGLQYMVLGVGVNLRPAAYPPDIAHRATSLESELGREVAAGPVLAEILAAFSERLNQLAAHNPTPLLERWRMLSPSATGMVVQWKDANGAVRTGKTAGIDTDGALRVAVSGTTERIISGTVTWI